MRFYYDDDGGLTIHGKLPGELGALVKEALESAMAKLESDAQSGSDSDENKTQSNVSAETFAETAAHNSAGASDLIRTLSVPSSVGRYSYSITHS